MKRIAIIYTAFLRPNLAKRTIKSLCQNSPENCTLLIGDQSSGAAQDEVRAFAAYMDEQKNNIGFNYYQLPYDCGLSFARNHLIQEAWKSGFEYCLVTADSIDFSRPYELGAITDFLDYGEKRILVGLDINGRVPWEFDIDLIPGRCFKLTERISEPIIELGVAFKRVGICRNLFVAKTDLLMKVRWDNELKLFEHEDWFYRVKQAGFECYHTTSVSADYINDKPPEYVVMRNRMYTVYRDILLKKHKIGDWVEYDRIQK